MTYASTIHKYYLLRNDYNIKNKYSYIMYINILNSLHHHHRTIYFSPLLFKILNFFTSSKCTIIFSLNLTPVIVLFFYTPLCPDKHASSKNIYTHYYHYSDHHIKTVAIYSHIENIFNYPSLIFP